MSHTSADLAITTKKTACNRDCPDGCSIIATLEGDKIVRLQGDPDHPVTKGFLCHRTSRFLERQYDPRRITRPLVRHDKGGPNDRWEEVSIESALDLVAEQMREFKTKFGPASIMNYRCGGSMGMMKYVVDYFFDQFGPVTVKSGDICAGAGDWAQEMDFGTQDSNDFFDLLNAKTIFLWGKNVFVSHVHLLPVLKQAKAAGTKLVLIDPIQHRTASICDQYYQIEPGCDAPLAFAIARRLLDQNKLDQNAPNYCNHWPEYLQLIKSKTFEQWCSLSSLSTEDVTSLASAYSDGPSTILVGWGMQRRRNGAACIRALDALALASGNIGKPGAGVSFYFPRRGAFDVSFKDQASPRRMIPEPLLGKGIEEASDPPIKMVFVSAANPVANVPDSISTRDALQKRFTVVVDMFMTDTAECADVILPAATMLEDDDLIGAYGHHYINKLTPVVAPPDDAMTDYQILQALAQRLDLGGRFEQTTNQWQQQMIAPLAKHDVSLDKIANESIRNPFAAKVVFENRVFPTADGKANLLTEYEHPQPTIDKKYPLRLMAISTDKAQAAQWSHESQQGHAQLTVNPIAAKEFADQDIVSIESELGQMKVQLHFDETQRSDVALMDKGGWLSAGRCANALIPAELSDNGECAVYYDTPIRLLRS